MSKTARVQSIRAAGLPPGAKGIVVAGGAGVTGISGIAGVRVRRIGGIIRVFGVFRFLGFRLDVGRDLVGDVAVIIGVRVQLFLFQHAAVGLDILAVRLDGVAGVSAVDALAEDIFIALCVDGDVDGVAVGIHAGALLDGDLGLLVFGLAGLFDDGLIRPGVDGLVAQLDMVPVALRRRAHELDVDVAAGDGGVDADGLFGVILELEIL